MNVHITFTFTFYRQNDITGVIDTTFTVERERFGEIQQKVLKPGGGTVTVTEKNKKEYVQLYVQYRFMRVSSLFFMSIVSDSNSYYELMIWHYWMNIIVNGLIW